MTLIVCLDDRNGLLFLGRRLSADRRVRENILELSRGAVLWMNVYSAEQFEDLPENVRVCETFLSQAGEEDLCFAENSDLTQVLSRVEKLIVYRWNRHYPSDRKFPWELMPATMSCTEKLDFEGFSHERITREVYAL